jgi:rod shape-determining protein MreC
VDALSKELALSRVSAEELEELKKLSASLKGVDDVSDKELKAANIISFEGSIGVGTFTINIGSEAGVKRNAVVLCGDGLVGRVLSSGKGWAQVVSIIDEGNSMGFQVEGKKTYLGVLRGDGSGKLSGYLLDDEATAKEGDEVFTSGVGGIYPGGVKIGVVAKATLKSDSSLMNVEVEPDVYFMGLKKVAVLV